MKQIIYIFFVFLINIACANEGNLSCTKNGMYTFFIPGAYTSKDTRDDIEVSIRQIFKVKSNYYDNKSQDVTSIPIASQGWVHDKLTYYMMKYGEKYGSNAEEAAWMTFGISELGLNLHGDIGTIIRGIDFSTIKTIKQVGLKSSVRSYVKSNIKDNFISLNNLTGQSFSVLSKDKSTTIIKALTSEDDVDFSTQFGKYASMVGVIHADPFGVKNVLNYVSILALTGELDASINQQRDTILATKWTINDNIDKVKNAISKKLNDNKKVIINAHAEGNQLAARAIAQLKQDPNYTNRVNKYVSILATSPTSDAYHGKYVYMKNDHDNRLLDITTPYNFILIPNFSVFDVSAGMSYNSHSTDNFLDFYISPINKAKRVNTIEKVAIRDLYIQDLRKSAELLESNCGDPILQLTSIDTNVIITNTPESNVYWKTDVPLSGKVLNLKVSDQNIYPFPVTTTYKWELYKGENLIQTGTDNQFSIQIASIPEPQSPWQGLYNLSDVSHPYGEIEVKNISYTLKLTSTNNLGINGYIETPINIDVTKQCKFTKFTFGETLDEFGNVGTNSVILKCGTIPCYKRGLTIGLASSFSGYDYVFTSLDDTERMLVSDIRDGSGEKVINAQICQNSNSDGDISISRTNSNDQLRIWNP